MNWVFKYDSLGTYCVEKAYISKVNDNTIILNEESIGYEWLDLVEFITKIDWFYNKEELENKLKEALNEFN